MENILKALLIKYDLGELVGDISPVSGGLMHQMYIVETDKTCTG
ncbi:hypothetical protein [Butyrivibrio sp. YAB3001]|nr:hypothetical protein [Butyrivibrio sp. YAB3001]